MRCCPFCGSDERTLAGKVHARRGWKQKYQCKSCYGVYVEAEWHEYPAVADAREKVNVQSET